MATTEVPRDEPGDQAQPSGPLTVPVLCGKVPGVLHVDTGLIVVANDTNLATELSPTEFERLAGRGMAKKWRHTIRVVQPDGGSGTSLGAWLKARNFELPMPTVGRWARRRPGIPLLGSRPPDLTAAGAGRQAGSRKRARDGAASDSSPSLTHASARAKRASGAAGGSSDATWPAMEPGAPVAIACHSLSGLLLLHSMCVLVAAGTPLVAEMGLQEFVEEAGEAPGSSWRDAIRVLNPDGSLGPTLGKWLLLHTPQAPQPPTAATLLDIGCAHEPPARRDPCTPSTPAGGALRARMWPPGWTGRDAGRQLQVQAAPLAGLVRAAAHEAEADGAHEQRRRATQPALAQPAVAAPPPAQSQALPPGLMLPSHPLAHAALLPSPPPERAVVLPLPPPVHLPPQQQPQQQRSLLPPPTSYHPPPPLALPPHAPPPGPHPAPQAHLHHPHHHPQSAAPWQRSPSSPPPSPFPMGLSMAEQDSLDADLLELIEADFDAIISCAVSEAPAHSASMAGCIAQMDEYLAGLRDEPPLPAIGVLSPPTVAGEPLDLRRLFHTVVSYGGYQVVTDLSLWPHIARGLGCSSDPAHAACELRVHYLDFLHRFEERCPPQPLAACHTAPLPLPH